VKRPLHPLHLREYTLKEIKNLVEKGGFQIEKVSGSGFYWFELSARLFATLSLNILIKASIQKGSK